nr:Verru_Chthon cassette protein D [Verrucomicrobium spinosum]
MNEKLLLHRIRLRRQAFTLVELLVVIAVMALLMALAGLTVPASMATQQLGGMARQLAADLEHAALLAQKESVPVEVRFYRYQEKEGLGGEEYRAIRLPRSRDGLLMGNPSCTLRLRRRS